MIDYSKDYYQILGVGKDASKQDISQAYKKLAKQYHPDLNPGDNEATKRFKDIAEAFDILNDDQKRQNYDLGSGGFGGNGFDPFSSIFGDFFTDRRTRRNAYILKECWIALQDVKNGCKHNIEIEKIFGCKSCNASGSTSWNKCSACNGQGQVGHRQGIFSLLTTCPTCNGTGQLAVEKCKICNGSGEEKQGIENIEISVPVGIEDNTNLILRNKGYHKDGVCDIIFNVRVKEHNFYKRKDNNLHCSISLTYPQCILGHETEIKDLDENIISVKVPPLTRPNTPIRLHGLGIKNGDIIITIKLDFPQKQPSEEYLELISKLDKVEV